MSKVNYLDSVLDMYGNLGAFVIWELYLQVNLLKYCDFDNESFDEVYYSLFIDDIEILATLDLSDKDNVDDLEYCEILYAELLDQAKYNYPIAKFTEEIQKSDWAKIIEDSQQINEQPINITVYNFYQGKYGSDNKSTRIIKE